jgi:hypothetical protein
MTIICSNCDTALPEGCGGLFKGDESCRHGEPGALQSVAIPREVFTETIDAVRRFRNEPMPAKVKAIMVRILLRELEKPC